MSSTYPRAPRGEAGRGGVLPPTPPLLAKQWLDEWRSLGGGITIGKGGHTHPWRMPPLLDPHAVAAAQLLDDFSTTPGMGLAVRAVMRAEVILKARR